MGLHRINGERLARDLNQDPEFMLHARELTGLIRLVQDDVPVFLLRIVGGEVSEVDSQPTPFDGFDIQLAGTTEHWVELLSATPQAFYQDWFPAMFHHGFRLEGNYEMVMAYYPALVRLRQVLVSALEGQDAA